MFNFFFTGTGDKFLLKYSADGNVIKYMESIFRGIQKKH